MANVSTREDDQTKADAERIADEIGISLSTAINIFLKRFVANDGFPFSVSVPKKKVEEPIIDKNILDAAVKMAVADPGNKGIPGEFTYLDPVTKKLITISQK